MLLNRKVTHIIHNTRLAGDIQATFTVVVSGNLHLPDATGQDMSTPRHAIAAMDGA
jgi:hypothetical protein